MSPKFKVGQRVSYLSSNGDKHSTEIEDVWERDAGVWYCKLIDGEFCEESELTLVSAFRHWAMKLLNIAVIIVGCLVLAVLGPFLKVLVIFVLVPLSPFVGITESFGGWRKTPVWAWVLTALWSGCIFWFLCYAFDANPERFLRSYYD